MFSMECVCYYSTAKSQWLFDPVQGEDGIAAEKMLFPE
jgi:hypothetical protein